MPNGNGTSEDGVIRVNVDAPYPPDFIEEERLRQVGRKESGAWSFFWSFLPGVVVEIGAVVVSWGASLVKLVAAKILPLISATEGTDPTSAAELNAAMVADILDIKLDAAQMRDLLLRGAVAEAFEKMGQAVLEGITEKILTEKELSPEQGLKSAHRFMGFMTNWVVKEGFQAYILSNLKLPWASDFDGIADELFRSYGLSRHARSALRPWFDTILATPLEWHVNKEFRPRLLAPGEAVRAHLRGGLTLAELKEVLARQGYSDKDIGHLIASIELPHSETSLLKLVHYKEISQDQALALMKEKGYSEQRAIEIFTALEIGPADSLIDQRKRIWLNAYLDGLVHQGEFENAIDQMPMGEREKQAWKDLAAIQRVIPRKKLSLSQMREAFLHGTIDLSEWNKFLRDEGYNDRDAQILTLELLLDLKSEKKGVSLSQLRAAFLDGLITEEQFAEALKDFPYKESARALILAQAIKDKLDAAPKPK